MKICITTQGEDENSKMSKISARSPYFLIYEGDKLAESIKNPFTSGGGAGYSVAQLMGNKEIELFVTGGQIGPVLKMTLEQKGIKMKSIDSDKEIKEVIIKIIRIYKLLKEIF